jgi:peroxiredoxin
MACLVSLSSRAQQDKRDFAPGSKEERDYRTANKRQDLILDSLKELVTMGQNDLNDVMIQSVREKAGRLEAIMKEDYPAYIRSNPGSGANMRLISDLVKCTPVTGWMDQLDSLYRLLPAAFRTSPEGKELGARLALEMKTALGHTAMDFIQYDMEGHSVSLSSFKGKYVLLDFWASWDNNCAKALPILGKAHDTYGSKGLVILGVSLDSNKNAWLDMIRQTNSFMTVQVSDLKGRENAAALTYGVTTLPKNLLIDPNGIIIARDLTALTLDQTLSSILE